MKSFSLIAALASLACTYATDVAGTLTEGSVFEFHNSKQHQVSKYFDFF